MSDGEQIFVATHEKANGDEMKLVGEIPLGFEYLNNGKKIFVATKKN